MVTFRSNNNRRSTFRSNNNRRTSFRNNNDGSKFSNNDSFQRKIPGRNNHNASKLIEKYNNLAREALSSGDKILSENYFQHADHFTRILTEQANLKKERFFDNSNTSIDNQNNSEKKTETIIEKDNVVKTEDIEAEQK